MTDPVAVLREALRDRYRLQRELGRGGMATVWLAHDLRHDRPVALKVLHPHLGAAMGAERFQREIRLAARLQHPHILSVFDSGEAAGLLWYTMPYVRGESLRDRLAREGRLPVDEAIRITREAGQALQYAHGEGVIHRDVKPENILLTADGSTLVADFGIARSLGTGSGATQQLTDTGLAIGTPAYMSPEQAMGEKTLDARTDQYALATVCWEMLAGALPFTGQTPAAMIASRLTVAPPSVRAARADVGEAQDQALRRALATRADDRFPSIADFTRALRVEQATPAVTPPVVTPAVPAAAPRWRSSLLLTLVLGVLLGLGALFAARRIHPPAPAPGQRRLAVLPFTNVGDTTDADFADGVTDAVRGKLTALPGLTVIASTSSNDYRGTKKGPGDIARELGVRYLLIGKVRWAKGGGGNRVQVSPELVEIAGDGTPMSRWQQPFDAALTDVFEVQGAIASQVARELGVALAATQQAAMGARPTNSPEAYDAYVRGLRYAGQASVPSIQKTLAYMRQATALDSTFGEAWAELSRAWAFSYLAITPSLEASRNADAAAERALRYAPDGGTTALARAMYMIVIKQDVAGAAQILEEGLRRSPNDARLLAQLGFTSGALGDWNGAVAQYEKARMLDPREPQVVADLAQMLTILRRYEDAERAADATLALRPMNLNAAQYKAISHLGRGDLAGARTVAADALRRSDPLEAAVHFAVYWDLYWLLDSAAQRLVLGADSTAFGQDAGIRALTFAQIYHDLGDRGRARAYGDTAAAVLEAQVRDAPTDVQRPVLLGLALTYAGRGDSGVRVARPVLDRQLLGIDRGYFPHQLARIYLLNGDRQHALDLIERILKVPYYVSPAWLRVDPNFAPLRGDPRFEKLAGGA